MQLGMEKLSDAVNGHKKLPFSLFGADFADFDRNIANRILPECFVREVIPTPARSSEPFETTGRHYDDNRGPPRSLSKLMKGWA